MATALQPLASPASIRSWNGRQALAEGLREGCGGPESVVTSMPPSAGFEVADGSRPHRPGDTPQLHAPSDIPRRFPGECRFLSQSFNRSATVELPLAM